MDNMDLHWRQAAHVDDLFAYPDVSQYEMHTKAESIDDELIDAVIVFVDITERITVKAHQYYY